MADFKEFDEDDLLFNTGVMKKVLSGEGSGREGDLPEELPDPKAIHGDTGSLPVAPAGPASTAEFEALLDAHPIDAPVDQAPLSQTPAAPSVPTAVLGGASAHAATSHGGRVFADAAPAAQPQPVAAASRRVHVPVADVPAIGSPVPSAVPAAPQTASQATSQTASQVAPATDGVPAPRASRGLHFATPGHAPAPAPFQPRVSPDETAAFMMAAAASHGTASSGAPSPHPSDPGETAMFLAMAGALPDGTRVSGGTSAAGGAGDAGAAAHPASSSSRARAAAQTASAPAQAQAQVHPPLQAQASGAFARTGADHSSAHGTTPMTPALAARGGADAPERRGRTIQPVDPPKKKGGARRVISIVLIVVGIALLVTAAVIFIRAQLGYKQAKDTYDKMEQAAVTTSDAGSGSTSDVIKVDFNALGAGAENVVGWIYVPGTVINYPVAQGTDNNQYLRHLPDGTYNENGTIFMDMDDAAPGMLDEQTTLYGHHMNDGSMFQFIDSTMDQDTFDTVGNVYYVTRDATYICRPLFTMQVPDTYGDARVPNFAGDQTLGQYLEASLAQAKAKASDATSRIAQTKKVLTLVTCAGDVIPRTTRAAMVCEVVGSVDAGAESGAATAADPTALGAVAADPTGTASAAASAPSTGTALAADQGASTGAVSDSAAVPAA